MSELNEHEHKGCASPRIMDGLLGWLVYDEATCRFVDKAPLIKKDAMDREQKKQGQ